MRRSRVLAMFASAWLSGCLCSESATTLRYACASSEDCASGYLCRLGECRSEADPCFDGELPRATGSPCDDANACTVNDVCSNGDCAGSAPPTFPDLDGDGFGDGAAEVTECPVPPGNSSDGSDCDDSNALIFRTVSDLRDDRDQDGYSSGSAGSQCVGVSAPTNGRDYYQAQDGTFRWTTANLGSDCEPTNASLFGTVGSVVQDNDQDGYPPNNNHQNICAGQSTTVGMRTYYSDGSGGYFMPVSDCINKNGGGTQCQQPFDVDDANAAVH
jgi:hypothetical protein